VADWMQSPPNQDGSGFWEHGQPFINVVQGRLYVGVAGPGQTANAVFAEDAEFRRVWQIREQQRAGFVREAPIK